MKSLLLSLWLAGPAFGMNMAVSVGDSALLFTLPAINGKVAVDAVGSSRVSLGDFVGAEPMVSGKGVVIAFLGPTRDNGNHLAALDRLQRRYRAKGIQVLAVTTDKTDLGTLSSALEDQRLSFPVLRDRHRVVAERYRTGTLPVALLVDRAGKVFAIGNPKGEAFETELDNEISAMLGS